MSIDNHTRSVVVVVVTRSVCLSILFFFGFAIHPPRFALSSHFALFLRDSSHWGGGRCSFFACFFTFGRKVEGFHREKRKKAKKK